MQDLAGKVAFVTGGASGMGLAMARSFAAAGMKVVIADIQQDALDSVKAEFEASNASVLTLRVDVTNRDAMEQAAKESEAAFGNVHVVVNNAGVAVGGTMDTMDYKDWDWITSVNIDGVVNGIQTFVPRMLAHGEGGHVVNTASMAGHLAVPGLGVYNTSKFAVVGMSETLRTDLAAKGIGVSVLCPGVVNTNIFNSERNRPADLASDSGTSALLVEDGLSEEERAARMAAIRDGAIDPQLVGEMVVEAIRSDELYIFTHPEFRTMVDERHSQITASFERWQNYRDNN